MKNRNSESGVAILLVMSAIMLLTILLASFSYDSELNKLKIFNSQDRAQARLNAEAGLQFALLKLRLYQQALNTLEKNKALKDVLPEHKIQGMITQPFIFPPPLPPSADIVQKTAVKEFVDSSVIDGHLSVSISTIPSFLNPNNLRIALPATNNSGSDEEGESTPAVKPDEKKLKLHENIEKEFVEFLSNALKEKREESPQMEARYGEYDPKMLIKELKYYVNDQALFEDDSKSEFEALYNQAGITPKHAPLTSLTELYLLVGWTEDIVKLVIDKMTVHEQGVIQVNDMTQIQLKMLFPNIIQEQIDEFFRYRDGNPSAEGGEQDEENAPHPFKNVQEFKELVTGKLAIIESGKYDERIEELTKAGLTLGVSGKLFKVITRGEMNQATVELFAIVELPIKEQIPVNKASTPPKKDGTEETTPTVPVDENEASTSTPTTPDSTKKDEQPKEYLPPRVVEIRPS